MEGWGNGNKKQGWDRKEEGEGRLKESGIKSRENVGMWFDPHPLLSFFILHMSHNAISCLLYPPSQIETQNKTEKPQHMDKSIGNQRSGAAKV